MKKPSVRLRAPTLRDASAVAALLGELGYPASSADVPARLDAVLAEGGAALLAVDHDDRALGLVCMARHRALHTSRPVAYITALVTTMAARGRGIGRLLVEAAIEWAREQGCERISLTSAEHRADAHAFYPKCGLPYTGRRFSAQVAPLENRAP